MFTRALLILSLLIVTTAPSPARGQAPDACQPGAWHTVYLPLVANGETDVPKSDVLRRIDESWRGMELGNEDVYDPSEDQPPPTPTGVTVKGIGDAVLVEVDFLIDRAHLHPRFQKFNVFVVPIDSDAEDDSAQQVGSFSDSDFVWQPGAGGYTSWLLAIDAESNTGVHSDRTEWQRVTLSTHYDDFASYGGDTITSVESLCWLQIVEVEPSEDWDFGASGGFSTNYVVQGAYSGRCYNAGGGMVETVADATLEKSMDLSVDSRFGDDDYLCLPVYVAVSFSSLDVYFIEDEGLVKYFYKSFANPATGWHYYQIKKSDFTSVNDASWANITKIQIIGQDTAYGPVDFYFDGWQVVKADPDDGDEANPTGRAWDFSGGTWAIFPGKRPGEPSYDYALGQVESDASDDYFATLPGVKMPANKVSAGVNLKGADGRAGVLFRVEDDTLGSENALAAEIDTAADTLYLVRYEDGSKTTLASTDLDVNHDRLVWIGVDFRDTDGEGRVNVHIATNEFRLFSSRTLQISHATARAWPDGQGVGLVAHDCNARFVEFRAGSPQTADFAHKAGHALTAGLSIEDYGAAVARRVNLGATVGAWSWGSVQRSTGNVYDSSGQGRTLTYSGNPVYNRLDNGVPYITLDGTGDYFSRTSETDLNILGTEAILDAGARGLTLIAWAYPTAAGGEQVIGKWVTFGDQRSYIIFNNSGTWLGQVSEDGAATTWKSGGSATTGQWHFLALRLVPSISLDLWCGTGGALTKYTNTTSIPASIFSGTAGFVIGVFTGRVGLCSLHFCNTPDEVVERIYQGELALYG